MSLIQLQHFATQTAETTATLLVYMPILVLLVPLLLLYIPLHSLGVSLSWFSELLSGMHKAKTATALMAH